MTAGYYQGCKQWWFSVAKGFTCDLKCFTSVAVFSEEACDLEVHSKVWPQRRIFSSLSSEQHGLYQTKGGVIAEGTRCKNSCLVLD